MAASEALPLLVSLAIFIAGALLGQNLRIAKARPVSVISATANATATPRLCRLISPIRYSALLVGAVVTSAVEARSGALGTTGTPVPVVCPLKWESSG